MERDILHLNIPYFPIALARASDPSLRRRPVAIAPSHSERTPVQCVSREAGLDGVLEGMPLFRARRLCPSLLVLPPDPGSVSMGGRLLLRLVRRYTPLWEPSSPGRFYLDLTGSGRLLGPGRDVALRLEKDLEKSFTLSGTVGVAGSKMVSSIASSCLDKPGICDVLRGSEAGFLAPLPVGVLPGVGSLRQRAMMVDLNLRFVGQVASMTVPQLALVFGAFAPLLHARAVGFDPTPVVPPRQAPEVAEEIRLDEGENDDAALLARLHRMAERCGRRLRRMGRSASRLELALTYSDGFFSHEKVRTHVPADDDRVLFARALDLFFEASARRVQIASMRLVCGGLCGRDPQPDLFEPAADPSKAGPLQESIDRVRDRFGDGAVRWGRCVDRVQSPGSRVQRGSINPKTKTRREKLQPNVNRPTPDSGLPTPDSEPLTLNSELSTLNSGLPTLDSGLWTLD